MLPLCSPAERPRNTMFPVMTLVKTPPRRKSPMASVEPVTRVRTMTKASRRRVGDQNAEGASEICDSTMRLSLRRAAAEERLDEDGIVLELLWRSREHHAPSAQHQGPVRDAQRRLGSLLHEQDGRSVFGEASDVLLEQLGRHQRREV